MNLMLSMVMSTVYCGAPSPDQGSTQAIEVICVGSGLRSFAPTFLPPVRSVQRTICVTGAAVSGIALVGGAQVPSYWLPVAGTQVPQVGGIALCAESTSVCASPTVTVTDAAGTPPSPMPLPVKVPWMSNDRPV